MKHPLKDTIFLQEAENQISGPVAFNLMIKPAGSLCNLDCHYCYYLDKADIYGGVQPRMTLEMLERITREYIHANDVPEVTFNWHGGEPLVMGLDFYRKAVEFQKKYADGKVIHNTIQTNATLLTYEMATFFRENSFLAGVSIDGPADVHDKYRKDKGGQPTFEKVIRGINILRQCGVEFNTLSTINKASEGRGLEVYQFLKYIGSQYMQFMPVVEHVKYPVGADGRTIKHARPYIVDPGERDSQISRWSVSPQGFGKFMCDIFSYWVKYDVGRYFVNLFDATLAGYCGVQPGTCAYAPTCGGNTVIEHNGDVYPCDHFVYPKYFMGNIMETPLKDMATSEKQYKFGLDKRNTLPSKCFSCRYSNVCHGECPKHRFNRTDNGESGLSALCAGYHMFYEHSAPYMLKMKELLEKGQSPAAVMLWAGLR